MITLYTIDCPKCNVLEKKLNMKNIKYETIKDINVMQEKGFQQAPVLEVDGIIYNFEEAIKFVNNY